MDLEERINQFQAMAEADPGNEMAHFSLGNVLLQAGKPDEAGESFEHAANANPEMSKAYQMAGQAFMAAGDTDRATAILTNGYKIAAKRGDLMVKSGIESLLKMLDAPVPNIEMKEVERGEVPEGAFICGVTGRPGTQLEKPPFRGKLGEKIYETVSQETWQLWLAQGTKVINELRLDLSRPDHQDVYDEQMIEFLGLVDWAREHLHSDKK